MAPGGRAVLPAAMHEAVFVGVLLISCNQRLQVIGRPECIKGLCGHARRWRRRPIQQPAVQSRHPVQQALLASLTSQGKGHMAIVDINQARIAATKRIISEALLASRHAHRLAASVHCCCRRALQRACASLIAQPAGAAARSILRCARCCGSAKAGAELELFHRCCRLSLQGGRQSSGGVQQSLKVRSRALVHALHATNVLLRSHLALVRAEHRAGKVRHGAGLQERRERWS